MMVQNVRGHFADFDVTINFDEARPERTTVEAQIAAASINTRMERRDAHLRSADFLDAENYPYLTFTSKRVELKDERHARLTGELTIRGISRDVALDVEYSGAVRSPWGSEVAGFSASTKIDRRDWGLTWNQFIEGAGVLVGDTITITIELELTREAAPVTELAAAG
jgi:polyisoprenoid-binding protein YceI